MEGISSRAAGTMRNKDKTFQGQKFDDDLGLDWVEFKWRNHDPQIGRFIEIDPLADKYEYNSTYAFSENKVTRHVELEGLEAVPFNISNPLTGIFSVLEMWHQNLINGAQNLANGASETAASNRGDYSNEPVPSQKFHAVEGPLSMNAGVAEMSKPGLDIGITVLSSVAGIEVPAEMPLVTGTSFGFKGSVSVSEEVVALGKPNFIVDNGGTVFPVPKGAEGPVPLQSGKGVQFINGTGSENGQVTNMRIMDPIAAKGKAPAYPNGYVKYTNASGQGVNIYTGQTGTRAVTHYPISPAKVAAAAGGKIE